MWEHVHTHLKGAIAQLHDDGLWGSIPAPHVRDDSAPSHHHPAAARVTSLRQILLHVGGKVTEKLVPVLQPDGQWAGLVHQ